MRDQPAVCFAGEETRRDCLPDIAAMFKQSRIPCRLLDDLRYGRWEKLVWNVPFNGLSAALNQTTDLLLGSPQGEALVRSLMEEVIASARAAAAVISGRV